MGIIKISNSYFEGKIKAMQLLLGCLENQAMHVSWRAGIRRTVKLICHKSYRFASLPVKGEKEQSKQI